MNADVLTESPWSQVSAFIADAIGLDFPRERWPDLQRGLAGAAPEFGCADAAACARWLLSATPSPMQLRMLADHLTIGETYFLREVKTFEALAANVLPALVAARRLGDRRLRLWSAGCCTGEEAYSLSILLHQVLPDWADWNISILATDINPRFLGKALAGVYSEWSFRGAPAGFRERHFTRTGDGRYLIRPEIREKVTFAHLNLAESGYPSLATGTNAMDLIFCRNVLMYFTPAQVAKVIANLRLALVDGGWLAVSPSEASQALFTRFATRNFPGVILYQKADADASVRKVPPPAALVPPPAHQGSETSTGANAKAAPVRPNEGEPGFSGRAEPRRAVERPDVRSCAQAARDSANEGRLADALAWCDRWVAADKLDAAAYYLRAIILLEQNLPSPARQSLQQAIYLEPGFILAHYALGNLARAQGRSAEVDKHFSNALHLLARLQPDEAIPASDGLTAGRLSETIAALTTMETVAR